MSLALLLTVALITGSSSIDEAKETIATAHQELIKAEQSGNLMAIRRQTAQLLKACLGKDLEALLAAQEDASLLRGCQLVIGTDHGLKGRSNEAVKVLGKILSQSPGSPEAKKALLPLARACSETSEITTALAHCRKATEILEAGSVEIREAWMLRGDLHAARGEVLDAQRAWSRLTDDLDRHGNDARARRNSGVRLSLLNKKAPPLTSNTWFGAEKRSLAQLKGKVVLLDFWATWCGPCRALMPGLNDISEKHREAGLEVLGVTKPYSRGWLPSKENRSQGQGVTGMDRSAFLMHIVEFRRRFGISYPFVLTGKTEFDSYRVGGIPMVVLIDRKGTIAWVKVGSGGEGLLETAIERLLAKK